MATGHASKLPPTDIPLSCGHTASFHAPLPQMGHAVYCARCADYRRVLSVEVWKIRCEGCRMYRSYGADRTQARRTAHRHVQQYGAGHTVEISCGGKHVERVSTDPDQGELPYDRLIQERREIAKNAQETLRRALDRPTTGH